MKNSTVYGEQMKLKGTLERMFAPRQIIVSTDGQPKYFTLGRTFQMTLVAGTVGVSSLIGGLILEVRDQNDEIALQEMQLDKLQETVRTVSSNLLYSKSNLALTKNELDRQYARLEDILSERQNLQSTLQVANANLEKKANDLNNRDQYAKDLESRIKMLSDRLQRTNSRSEDLNLKITQINKELYETTEERDLHAEEKLIAQKRLSSLNRELQMFQSSKDEIYKELQQTKGRLSTFEKERSDQKQVVASLRSEVSDLQSRISTISKENKSLIQRVHAQAEQSIDALKETIVLTGLNPDEVLSLDNIEGIGGPFHDLTSASKLLEIEEKYYRDAQMMEASLTKWTTLNSIMKNIPLARPVDTGYISSSYGKRRDPVTKRRAFHAGVDIAGPKNSPILATAPGKVTFAGRNGPYGLMVEIDHGQGFKTKFGHLKKIKVKKGQLVDFRTTIGIMGSSGRSTGRHVHYEVIYNGKHQNPAKFFKAGNYAYKTSSASDVKFTQ